MSAGLQIGPRPRLRSAAWLARVPWHPCAPRLLSAPDETLPSSITTFHRSSSAQYPAERRDASRLLVYPGEARRNRAPYLLGAASDLVGELVVVDDTKSSRRASACGATSGARPRSFSSEPLDDGVWEALARPSRRLGAGERRCGAVRWSSRSGGDAGGFSWRANPAARRRSRRTSASRWASRRATRRSTPRSAGPLRHPRPACTSRLSSLRGSTRAGHPARRPRHVPAGHRARAGGTRDRWRAVPRHADSWARIAAAGGVLAVGTTTVRVLETVARRASSTAGRCCSSLRASVSGGRGAADELPPAAIDASRAGDGVRGRGRGARPLSERDRERIASTRSATRWWCCERALPPSLDSTVPPAPASSTRRAATSRRRSSCPSAPGDGEGAPPDECARWAPSIILGNTYHLFFRPGVDVMGSSAACTRSPAGTGRSSPTPAASRSSRSRHAARGRRRRRHVPLALRRRAGSLHARSVGGHPAAARLRHRDVLRPLPAGRRRRATSTSSRSAGRRLWAERQVGTASAGSGASGSCRAGPTPSSGAARSRRSPRSTSTATRSAGWRSARTGPRCSSVAWAAPLLPAEKPRYLMGVGDAEGSSSVIAPASTCSTACCRPARRGPARPDGTGTVNLRNARYARDPGRSKPGASAPRARILPRVHPTPRQPEGDPRASAAELHDLWFVHSTDRTRARCDPAGVFTTSARSPRSARRPNRGGFVQGSLIIMALLLRVIGC